MIESPGITVAPAKKRYQWLDAARGIGIILVTIGHALGGLFDSPLGDGHDWLRQTFFLIYTFHMPLFFMLSGALVDHRIQTDRSKFRQSLLTDVVWPYFLWSTVQFTVIFLLGNLTNRPQDALWPTLIALPIVPISQFWFLYAIFLLHALALVTLRALGRDGFLLLCLALKPLVFLIDMPLVVKLAALQAPWYGIGVFLAAGGLSALAVERPVWARLALPIVAAGLCVTALFKIPDFTPTADLLTAPAPVIAGLAWYWAVFPAAIVGALAVIGIAGLNLGRVGGGLQYLGRRSMPIFILHIMGIAGTRILLVKGFGITEPAVLLPVIVLAGIVFPLVAFEVLARLGWTRALGLGRP
ncbi:MAG: acyltransferase family protein [Sphingomonadaceae bacterium]